MAASLSRGGARRSISSRGSIGHQWPERSVSTRRPQRSAQVEGGRARACRDPSRPLGLMRPPSAPRRQRFDWIDCIRAAPGYQLSRRARTTQRFRRNAWSVAPVVPRKFCVDAAHLLINASVRCFARNLASQRY